MAARVASSLQNRAPLTVVFCEEVIKKVQEIMADGEKLTRDHENHVLFKREHDEQLLLWMNRYVSVWGRYDLYYDYEPQSTWKY